MSRPADELTQIVEEKLTVDRATLQMSIAGVCIEMSAAMQNPLIVEHHNVPRLQQEPDLTGGIVK